MSVDAFVPCFCCGETLKNVVDVDDCPNQPSGGTEFYTYGHYGSTFWDSFDREALVLNICDRCLRSNPGRLARRKYKRPARVESVMVPYEEERKR